MAKQCKSFRTEIEHAEREMALSVSGQAHLEQCSECLAVFEENEKVRRWVGGLERVEAPSDFDFRLRARLASARQSTSNSWSPVRFRPGLVSVSLALMFAISITVAVYQRKATTNPVAIQISTPVPVNVVAELPVEMSKTESIEGETTFREDRAVMPKIRERATMRQVELRGRSRPVRATGALEFGLESTQVFSGPNVSIKVSAEPLSMVLRDETGVAHRVKMKPVSFGAQNLVSRAKEVPRELVANNEGIW